MTHVNLRNEDEDAEPFRRRKPLPYPTACPDHNRAVRENGLVDDR